MIAQCKRVDKPWLLRLWPPNYFKVWLSITSTYLCQVCIELKEMFCFTLSSGVPGRLVTMVAPNGFTS